MSSPSSAQEVISIVERMTEEHGHPALIIVDTLNRNFGSGDENSTADMTRFVHTIDYLKYELSCAVLIVHHSGLKDKDRGRGSNALYGALDWEYILKKEGGKRRLHCTKPKDHEQPDDMHFDPEVITVGHLVTLSSGEVEPITSVVLNVSDSMPTCATDSRHKLSTPQKIALETLRELCSVADSGRVDADQWSEAALLKNISSSSDSASRKKAFTRSIAALQKKNYVETESGFYWVKDSGQDMDSLRTVQS